jgi:hypothetical protein
LIDRDMIHATKIDPPDPVIRDTRFKGNPYAA